MTETGRFDTATGAAAGLQPAENTEIEISARKITDFINKIMVIDGRRFVKEFDHRFVGAVLIVTIYM